MKTPILILIAIFFLSFSITIFTAIRTPELRQRRNLGKVGEIAVATFALILLITAFVGSVYLVYFKK